MIRCYNAEVVVDSDKANLIELTTRNHSHDDDESVVWFTERRRRITLSNVRTIVKHRSTTAVAHTVNQLLYSTFHGYSYRDLSVSDAIAANKCDCLAINNSHIELKHTHSYYYQVQMAMFCTKREWCDFILRTTIDYYFERVQIDESFCARLLPSLRRFYVTAILSELAFKAKPIREPKEWIADEENFLQEMERLVA